ncbi:MAG: HAMP domain-containing histidine kinase [Lachnospiraceae bacterium]|nr:HAMP domain-containing histidine kinase [Lachnospiraceae bacterium]
MWWIKAYAKRHRLGLALYVVFVVTFAVVMYLYQLPLEAVGYAAGLCTAFGLAAYLADSLRYRRRTEQLGWQLEAVRNGVEQFPRPCDEQERLYQELLEISKQERLAEVAALMKEKKDVTDYFTMWTHQIKTPIAAMGLLLQQEASGDEAYYKQLRQIKSELFKIEQYVDMVMQYLRLTDGVNDFVLREYELDSIIRQALHKYAPMFIRKKLALVYEPVGVKVATDEKWMVFVLEQLLSNAIKYTASGEIRIYMEKGCLVVEDTGIGILPEDLPRVFDKGYTGYNGRSDKKASGIGLYLVRQILVRLGHKIFAESESGTGTRMKVLF